MREKNTVNGFKVAYDEWKSEKPKDSRKDAESVQKIKRKNLLYTRRNDIRDPRNGIGVRLGVLHLYLTLPNSEN